MADREIMRLSAQETADWLGGKLEGTWTDRIHDPEIRRKIERQREELQKAVWIMADAFIKSQEEFSPESAQQLRNLEAKARAGDMQATHHMVVMIMQLTNIAFGWEQQ